MFQKSKTSNKLTKHPIKKWKCLANNTSLLFWSARNTLTLPLKTFSGQIVYQNLVRSIFSFPNPKYLGVMVPTVIQPIFDEHLLRARHCLGNTGNIRLT